MTHTLLSIFPNPDDLLSLGAEELGGVLLEIVPGVMQMKCSASGLFTHS